LAVIRRDGAARNFSNATQIEKVLDFLQSLVLVGKLEEVEIRIRRHHIIGLAAYPSAHVDVAESGAARG
jgi:hypothetical protein